MISEKEVLTALDKFKHKIIELKQIIREKDEEIVNLKSQISLDNDLSQKIIDVIGEIESEISN